MPDNLRVLLQGEFGAVVRTVERCGVHTLVVDHLVTEDGKRLVPRQVTLPCPSEAGGFLRCWVLVET